MTSFEAVAGQSKSDHDTNDAYAIIEAEMDAERQRFEQISLEMNSTSFTGDDLSIESMNRRRQLGAELIESQQRFAQLCEKNVKLMAKDNPILDNQQKSDNVSIEQQQQTAPPAVQTTAARKSLSSQYRAARSTDTYSESNGTNTGLGRWSASVDSGSPAVQTRLPASTVISKYEITVPGSAERPSLSPMASAPISGSNNGSTSLSAHRAYDRQADFDGKERILKQIKRARDQHVEMSKNTIDSRVESNKGTLPGTVSTSLAHANDRGKAATGELLTGGIESTNATQRLQSEAVGRNGFYETTAKDNNVTIGARQQQPAVKSIFRKEPISISSYSYTITTTTGSAIDAGGPPVRDPVVGIDPYINLEGEKSHSNTADDKRQYRSQLLTEEHSISLSRFSSDYERNGSIGTDADQISRERSPVMPSKIDGSRLIIDGAMEVGGGDEVLVAESAACRDWDPTLLIDHLYNLQVDYQRRSESKRNKFVNMEGHMDHLPLGMKTAYVEKQWQTHYFRTHEGRLQWFNVSYTEEHPFGDILLSGADVDVNQEEHKIYISGGRDHAKLTLRAKPDLPQMLFDKWRQALLSHAASSVEDSYLLPIHPPIPHYTQKVIIVELGSSSIRAGPLTVDPSLPQSYFPAIANILPNGKVIIGKEALKPDNRIRGHVVKPIRSIEPGNDRYAINMDLMRCLLDKVFTDLRVNPESYKVLLSVPQNVPTSLVGDLIRLLVSRRSTDGGYGVKGAAVTRHPCLVLYAYDVTTGVVVDIGDRLNIVPVVDGYVVENAIISLPYGSRQIMEALRSKLTESSDYSFMSSVESLLLRYAMEQSCFVAEDYDEEVNKYRSNPKDVDMTINLDKFKPTNDMAKTIRMDSCRFASTEGLFKPKKWGLDISGLHQLVFQSVQNAPIDSRRNLYRNVYLAGGCSLLPGLAERLESELSKLVASTIHIQVHISPWRYHAAYLGAQVLAGGSQFDDSLVDASNVDDFVAKLNASTF